MESRCRLQPGSPIRYLESRMHWLVVPLLLFLRFSPEPAALAAQLGGAPTSGVRQNVTAVSFTGSEFIRAFNNSADRARLVLVFSPT